MPLSYLPIRKADKVAKRKAEEKGLFVPFKKALVEAANNEVIVLNQKFKEDYSVTFENAYKLAGKAEERRKRSEVIKEVKEDIELQWEETAVVR